MFLPSSTTVISFRAWQSDCSSQGIVHPGIPVVNALIPFVSVFFLSGIGVEFAFCLIGLALLAIAGRPMKILELNPKP